MPVIDASVVVAYFVGGDKADEAEAVISGDREGLLAPYLIDAEVGHSLRRLEAAGKIAPAAAEDSLADLADLPLQRSPHSFLLESAWGMRARVSFYDALYLALGAELGLPVITQDARLARAGASFGVQVDLL